MTKDRKQDEWHPVAALQENTKIASGSASITFPHPGQYWVMINGTDSQGNRCTGNPSYSISQLEPLYFTSCGNAYRQVSVVDPNAFLLSDKMLALQGKKQGDPSFDNRYDLDRNGIIDVTDLGGFMWNVCANSPVTPSSGDPNAITYNGMKKVLGKSKNEQGYLARYDLNNDGTIDIFDYAKYSQSVSCSVSDSSRANSTRFSLFTALGLLYNNTNNAAYDIDKNGRVDINEVAGETIDYCVNSLPGVPQDVPTYRQAILLNGKTTSDAGFDPKYDINQDGSISILDSAMVGRIACGGFFKQ